MTSNENIERLQQMHGDDEFDRNHHGFQEVPQTPRLRGDKLRQFFESSRLALEQAINVGNIEVLAEAEERVNDLYRAHPELREITK